MRDFEKAVYSVQNPATRVGPLWDVKEALDRAATLSSRVEALVEALMGPHPGAESDSDRGSSISQGVLYELSSKASYTASRIASAERALERIEKEVI